MRRRQVPLVEFSDAEPPQELLWFIRTGLAPTAEGGAAFLRARNAWRVSQNGSLPPLSSLDRAALRRLGVPSDLIDAENKVDRSSRRGGTGRLPQVAHSVDGHGNTRLGVSE